MEQIKIEKGQLDLALEIKALYIEILQGKFGDFTNKEIDAPKSELVNRFNDLATNVKEGKYDNSEVVVVEQKGLVNIWETPFHQN